MITKSVSDMELAAKASKNLPWNMFFSNPTFGKKNENFAKEYQGHR
jgi:hypothetical protein